MLLTSFLGWGLMRNTWFIFFSIFFVQVPSRLQMLMFLDLVGHLDCSCDVMFCIFCVLCIIMWCFIFMDFYLIWILIHFGLLCHTCFCGLLCSTVWCFNFMDFYVVWIQPFMNFFFFFYIIVWIFIHYWYLFHRRELILMLIFK